MFLVCKDILYGLNENEYIKREGSKVVLSIPSDSKNFEVFSFDDFPIEDFGNKDIILRNVSVRTSKSKTFVRSINKEPHTIYALLRGANCVPDDVFIKTTQSCYFKLIKKIAYKSCEPDYGIYPTAVYFVKINLKPFNLVEIYFAGKNSSILEEHIVFYCDYNKRIKFKNNLETFILNSDEFISLSKLNSEN